MNIERRIVPAEVEFRANDGGGVLEGYAAVFNRYSDNLGGFVEQVEPGAFAKTIAEADIRALFNHEPSSVLGRNRSETLRLSEDSTGLHYEVDLPDTQQARDVARLVERKDVTGSSFGFLTIEDEWGLTDQEFPLRTLKQVKLFDVGPVTFPAYPSTQEEDVAAAVRSLATQLDRPVKELVAAAGRNELRSLIVASDESEPGPEQHSTLSPKAVARALELMREDV